MTHEYPGTTNYGITTTRTFDRGVEIATAETWTLQRELAYTIERIADGMRVCGIGYPDPRYDTVRAITVELVKRGAALR